MASFTASTQSCTPGEERGTIVNAQGLKLATFAWKVEGAKGVVLALHGYGAMTKCSCVRLSLRPARCGLVCAEPQNTLWQHSALAAAC